MRVEGHLNPITQPNRNFKMITTDNKFLNFIVLPNKSLLTPTGSVKIQPDSVYIEKMNQSINTTLNRKNNKLHYQIKDGKLLYIKFFIEKNSLNQPLNKWYEEAWMRIDMYNAQ